MAIKFKPGDRVVFAQYDLFSANPLEGCAGTVTANPKNSVVSVLFDRNVQVADVAAANLELLEVNHGTQARLQEQT